MSNKPKPRIGHVDCAHCGRRAGVSKTTAGRLFYTCPACGVVMPKRPEFQDWILEHATIYSPADAPPAAAAPAAATRQGEDHERDDAGRVQRQQAERNGERQRRSWLDRELF